jgi:hypothetical protein
MKYHLLTWNEVHKQCKEVAKSIRRSGFYPDVIVALARSGFVPGRILSDLLSVEDLFGLKVHHVITGEMPETGEVDVQNEYEAAIPYKAPLNIKGQNTLAVDDITGTGKSMTAAVQFMESLAPKVLKTATLSYSTESIIRPDFFVSTVSEDDWVLYPWNYFEDFGELIMKAKKKIKQKDPSAEVLSQAITDNFGVTLPMDDLKYVLEEMKEPRGTKTSKQ